MPSAGTESGTIRFGPFELDRGNRELRRRAHVVRLQPQPFAVLVLIVESAGKIVSRDEIRQRIWRDDTFVDFERGISFAISQIREALGDNAAKPRFVETIPRRGYRFIAEIGICPEPQLEMSASTPETTTSLGGESGKPEGPPPAVLSLPKWMILAGSLGLFATLALVLIVWRPWRSGIRAKEATAPQKSVRTESLMSFPGQFFSVALSPDASQIAFTWNGSEFGKWNIYVQRIGGGRPLQITNTQGGMIAYVDWSPDGRLLVFGRCGHDGQGALYVVPALGGVERRVTDVACAFGVTGAVWTPDGQSLLFSDACDQGEPLGIAAFTFATGRKRCLAAPTSDSADFYSPMASPDGQTVAFVRDTTMRVSDLFTVPFRGGPPQRLTSEGRLLGQFVWASDGKSIIFTSDREGLDGRRVWKVSVKGGPIEPEDDALLAKIYPRQTPRSALSRDRHHLAYVGLKVENSSVWRVRLAKPGGKVLTQARILQSADQLAAPGLSPDGTHVSFTSTRSGAENVWTCDVTGHGTLQLTSFSGELVGAPRWSPDGNWLVFDGRAENHAQIFMIDSEGHNMHALTTGEHENGVPIWSRNGKAIYFVSNRSGKHELWKQDIATALSTQITQHGGGAGAESYDGRYLYYTKHQSSGIWRMPIDGGEEERIMDMPEPWYSGYWDVSESGLYFYDVAATPRPAIKYYDFQTRQITTVLEPDEQGMEFWPALSASRDGRTLLYGTVSWNSTLMIADEIR